MSGHLKSRPEPWTRNTEPWTLDPEPCPSETPTQRGSYDPRRLSWNTVT